MAPKRPYQEEYRSSSGAPHARPPLDVAPSSRVNVNGTHQTNNARTRDTGRPEKRARISPPTSSATAISGSSQQNPVVLDDDEPGLADEEDDDAHDGSQEVADSSQSGISDAEAAYGLYGELDSKIVGCRFYSGMATVGEIAMVRREPRNQYDSNAIQVLNVNGAQIGHVPRTSAAKLAPYMDRRELTVEAIITGHKSYYDCPIALRLYGTHEPAAREALLAKMRADKLPTSFFRSAAAATKEEKEKQKLAAKAAKEAKKAGAALVGMGQGQQWGNGMSQYIGGAAGGGFGEGLSMDDIIGGSEKFDPRRAEQFTEEFGIKESDLEAMPKAKQPHAIATQMHPFQLQGLQWLLDAESPALPASGSRDIVQLWQRHASVPNAFTNLATNFSVKDPSLASGGILADDMGLGKTIQVISLIMADRELGRKAPDACNANLILAPVSVMSNWSTQMKKHIKPEHALRIMFWHGARKQPITPKEIGNYDVVISTYDSVSSEWHSQKSTILPRKTGVFSVTWRRIILDEGHNIRNPKAKRTIAVSNLLAQSRWALTGTPIVNNLKDLFSLVRFLRLSGGLNTLEFFHGAIMRPVLNGDAGGNRALQLLMKGVCLRRKKEMSFIDLRLPPLTEYVHKVTLLPHEQEKYDALDAQAKGTLDMCKNNKGGKYAYSHLLEILLRMRQVCNHWRLVNEERLDAVLKQLEAEGMVDLTEENVTALQKLLRLSIDSQEECPICMESYTNPVITKCAHVFCTACIERVIEGQHKCPMCRAELDSLATTTVKPAKEKAAAPPPTQDQLHDAASLESNMSSKVLALLQILQASAKQDPTNKTIVFSQWTSFLDLIRPQLTAQGFTATRIDGSMHVLARDAALDVFDTDPKCTIMLASLGVCSVGLNLVAANQVVLADSWWAPAIEDQAVDRVHRLGQRRETKVFRLVVEGSIEERVLGIQGEKRKLMGVAFAEKVKRGAGARPGLGELARLLGDGNASARSAAGAGASRGSGGSERGVPSSGRAMREEEETGAGAAADAGATGESAGRTRGKGKGKVKSRSKK